MRIQSKKNKKRKFVKIENNSKTVSRIKEGEFVFVKQEQSKKETFLFKLLVFLLIVFFLSVFSLPIFLVLYASSDVSEIHSFYSKGVFVCVGLIIFSALATIPVLYFLD